MQDRTFRAEGGGDAGYRVGAARAGGGDDDTELAGLAGVTVGGVGGGLLVADVDDTDPFVDAAVVNVDDVAATQGEDRVDALGLEGLGDQMAAGYHGAVAAFLRQCVLGGGLGGR